MAIKSYHEDQIIKFEDVFTEKHMKEAYKHVRCGKKKRDKVIRFHMNQLSRLNKIYKSVLNETYTIGELSKFTVYEPKQREVVADLFNDKIIQDIIAKHVLRPLIAPKVIYDNYASQPGKGTHMALGRLQRYCRIHAKSVGWTDEGWVMTGDIAKFFYNIDHTVMWNLINELPIDNKLKRILKDQIDTCNASINPYSDRDDKGLCIGFQVSQWMAIYYLDKLDHYIKEELGIKCYGRYMDDFFLIHKDRKYLEECYKKIEAFVEEKLFVKLNKKSNIHPFSQGICFLGYHVTYNKNTHQVDTVVRTKRLNRMIHRAKVQKKLIRDGKMTVEEAEQSITSWHAYACHGENEKVENAYNKALKVLNIIYNPPEIYAKMLRDPNNIDPDGFFVLHTKKNPKPEEYVRDADGYYVLVKRKLTKEENDFRKHQQEVWANPNKYVRSNMRFLLGMVKRKKRETKKTKAYKRMQESLGNMEDPYND